MPPISFRVFSPLTKYRSSRLLVGVSLGIKSAMSRSRSRLAGALGMMRRSCALGTPGTTGARGTNVLHFEAASCKGRVEGLSGGGKARMATCPLITRRAVPMR